MHNPFAQEYMKAGMLRRARYAACLLLALLLLAGCSSPTGPDRNNNPATPTAIVTPTPTASAPQPVTLRTMHMLAANQGWAITTDNRVLISTSGPRQWRDVTPPVDGQKFTVGVAFFLDQQYAWLTLQFGDKYSVFRTYDGGTTWLETPLATNGGGPSSIQFIDPYTGWLLFSKNTNDQDQQVDVWQTADGGSNWNILASSDKDSNGNTSLVNSGQKTGIQFQSVSSGWITGTVGAGQKLSYYQTRDGGITWKNQPISEGETSDSARLVLPPTFFDAKNGVLPVITAPGDKNTLTIYSTQDGGQNWQARSATPSFATSLTTFFSPQHGWAIATTKNTLDLYTTTNGGNDWQKTATLPATIVRVTGLQFVSQTTGWLIGADKNEGTQLLETLDGGKSWQAITTSATA